MRLIGPDDTIFEGPDEVAVVEDMRSRSHAPGVTLGAFAVETARRLGEAYGVEIAIPAGYGEDAARALVAGCLAAGILRRTPELVR
jgi:hypothetical protein